MILDVHDFYLLADEEDAGEEEDFDEDDDDGSDEPGLKEGENQMMNERSQKLIYFHFIQVYNEDLEEDNSDWNEVGEDEEEDDIDSDGNQSMIFMLI